MSSHVNGLYRLRVRKGFDTRGSFADACGVDPMTVWRWETGRRSFSAEACRTIAGVLGVTMEQVMKAVEKH